MTPHFASWQHVEALRLAADRWIGTPFIPHGNIRGAGVDCVNLCAELFAESGFKVSREWPRYAMDGGKHNRESQLIAWLDGAKEFTEVWSRHSSPVTRHYTPEQAMPGDLLCFTIGRTAHHAGLLIGGPKFIHCLFGPLRKVMFATLADASFKKRLTAVYRPVQPSTFNLQPST